MKLSVILNDKKEILEAEPQTPLSKVLREKGLISVKNSGQNGTGLSCTVLLDGKPVPSDIIPFAIIKNANIITLEYFETTNDYQDIKNGFDQAGIKLCGYCNSGMIFTAYDILHTFNRPTVQEIEESFSGLCYCCTGKRAITQGIRSATAYRNRRIGSLRNGRK